MGESDFIARQYGTAGLMAYDQHVRQLVASGLGKTKARQQALEFLHTCPKCGHRVSTKKGAANRRQHASGRLEHIDNCAAV